MVERTAKQKKHIKEIGERIRVRRRAVGLSQEKLAEKLGITDKSIQNWEQGINPPGFRHFKNLEQVLETTHDWLWTGKGSSTAAETNGSGSGVSYSEFSRWRGHADDQLAAMRDEIAKLRKEVERHKKSRSTSAKSKPA